MPSKDGPILIRICYIKNGKEHSACRTTDALGEFSWTPPKGVTEVYFRANDTTKDGSVILDGGGGPITLLHYHAHKADATWTEIHPVGGKISGKVVRSEKLHHMGSFKYEQLPAEINTFQLIEEEDVELKISPKLREMIDKKQTTVDDAAQQATDNSEPSKKKRTRRNFWWNLTHKRPSF